MDHESLLLNKDSSLLSKEAGDWLRSCRFAQIAIGNRKSGNPMKICKPHSVSIRRVSGVVMRYLHEKIGYIDESRRTETKHVLIGPAQRRRLKQLSARVFTRFGSPLVSRTRHTVSLLNLGAVGEILPGTTGCVESADPSQLGWKAFEGRARVARTRGRILHLAFSGSVRAKKRHAPCERRHVA